MAKIEDVRCIVCDAVGEWENVDEFRLVPKGMHICKCCGFVYYPERYQTEEEAKKYYKEEYRQPPTIQNAFTGHKKLQMHAHFLKDVFERWKSNNNKAPVIGEVGAAYGLFLNWVRGYFPEADINGTEYTLSFRRVAWHQFNIKLDLDLDLSKKYDLLMSFKVAEHQLDADKRIREMALALKDDGLMYISVPTWFEKATNFGVDGFDLEYYYHPDHINVWHKSHFEHILNKSGLEIVKFDDWMYDESYLVRRNDAVMGNKVEFPSIDEIKERMGRIKAAFLAYKDANFKAAIETFPNYPDAWVNFYERHRADPHKQTDKIPFESAWSTFIEPALKHCPNNLVIHAFAAEVCMRYDQWDKAIEFINTALNHRPNNGPFLFRLQQIFNQMSLRAQSAEDKLRLLQEARDCAKYLSEVDLQMKYDAINWVYQHEAKLPMPGEG